MPSSTIRSEDPASHLVVLHEDLVFHCRDRACQVTATYMIQASVSVEADLAFLLPGDRPVNVVVGGIGTPAVVSRLGAPPRGFEERLDLRRVYVMGDSSPLPALYQAAAHVRFVLGMNRVSFSYDQLLGAREFGQSYLGKGHLVPHLIYVLWPLREWLRNTGFTIALRIEMDREPPGWWKRTFGHPPDVDCYRIEGQRAQIGDRLVYTATLPDSFPDYLSCWVGDS